MLRTCLGLCLILVLPLALWAETADESPVTPDRAPARDPAPAVSQLPIQDAIDGLVDEDELTRRAAFERLDQATATDLPVLEKSADSDDPEIRRQVTLILKRLKRGTFAFQAIFPDGSPAGQLKFSVRLYAGTIDTNNQEGPGMILTTRGQEGVAKEVFAAESASAADGRVVVGRFNDGTLSYRIETQDPLPKQAFSGVLTMAAGVEPMKFVVKRGVTVTVTVTDGEGQPVPEVMVFNAEDSNFIEQTRLLPASQARAYMGSASNAQTDEKGVAVLEKIGLQAINIVASKDGFDTAYQENIAAKDGSATAVKLKLTKTKPVAVTISLRDIRGKIMPATRVLAIRQNDLSKILGLQWNINLNAEKTADYIKDGALDLGTLPAASEVAAKMLPDFYLLVGFSEDGKQAYFGNLNIAVTAKDTTINAILRPAPQPRR